MMRLLTILFLTVTFTACANDGKQADTTKQTAILAEADTTKQASTLVAFFDKADAFLSDRIKNGKVAYKTIKQEPAKLNELVKMIGNVSLDDATSTQKKAFYINAYNILTINSIIENGIPPSPMDVDGFFDTIKHDVAGKKMTLDEIEKGTLFPMFGDARMHFALVCAAVSCPPIRAFAYMPEKLDSQLDEVTRKTLRSDFIRVNSSNETVELSEIFKWYKQDFLSEANSVLAYINQYRNEKIPDDFSVGYYEYDWSLNDVEG